MMIFLKFTETDTEMTQMINLAEGALKELLWLYPTCLRN